MFSIPYHPSVPLPTYSQGVKAGCKLAKEPAKDGGLASARSMLAGVCLQLRPSCLNSAVRLMMVISDVGGAMHGGRRVTDASQKHLASGIATSSRKSETRANPPETDGDEGVGGDVE